MNRARISNLFGKITIVVVICYFCLPAQAKYGGGKGEPNEPYLIYDANQMNAIGADSDDWDKNFKLMADIDLSVYTGTQFNIIGTDIRHPFTGVFDGNGHTISNFSYASASKDWIGLFGYAHWGAEFKDLGLIDPNVVAGMGNNTGTLVGMNRGIITNCYVKGGSVSGYNAVGGLVGVNSNGIITNCYVQGGSASGTSSVGGLVGLNFHGAITDCYTSAGASGYEEIGGLVGLNEFDTIENCYSTGRVSGTSEVGGLVGENYRGTVRASFWDIETSGKSTSAGGVGKTTLQMQDPNTFMDAGWDFVGEFENGPGDIWAVPESGGYPIFWWQLSPLPLLPTFSGGLGTKDDPYLISTTTDLNRIGYNPRLMRAHFKLIRDIDLAGLDLFIIGNKEHPYSGVFDGNGHTISNFTHTSTPYMNYVGLFALVYGVNAEIKNLGLIDPNIDTGEEIVGILAGALIRGRITDCYIVDGSVSGSIGVGGLVGLNSGGTITNCYLTGSVLGYYYYIGGLVGLNSGTITNSYSIGSVSGGYFYIGGLVGENDDSGTIANCHSKVSVSGEEDIGGLVGSNGGTITNCYSSSIVSGEYIGGLVGNNYHGTITNCYSTGSAIGYIDVGGLGGYSGGTITNCYSTVSVEGTGHVGGMVGRNKGGTIANCYSTGSVMGNGDVGGLVGLNDGGVMASFWDIQTSGRPSSDGGTGKTTTEMHMAITFIGWGCEPVWTIDEGVDYPRLAWENMPGELLPQLSEFLTGSGTKADPYLIYTSEQLNLIGLFPCEWNRHFLLCADIDLSIYTGTSFNIIGYYLNSLENKPFTGVFDGNGHKIYNFTYFSAEKHYMGLFGYVTGEIKDLGLIDPNVDVGTGYYVGSLVGFLVNGTVTNCYAEEVSISGDYRIGGLVGYNGWDSKITYCYATSSVSGTYGVGGLVGGNYGSRITNCYSAGSVSGNYRVGGLAGWNDNGEISNSYSSSEVSGTNEDIGGLVGWNNSYGAIRECYSTGSVSGDDYVGGLVGCNDRNSTTNNCYSKGSVSGNRCVGGLAGQNGRCRWGYCFPGTISNCFSTGGVSGNNDVGGLAGYNEMGEIIDSFWDIETSGKTTSAGGTDLPTTEMQMQRTFTKAGWDFTGETVNGVEDIWFIPQQEYPHLWWEGMRVTMKLTPRKLNCRSEGNWVKAHLTLPEDFTLADVDSNRPAVLHSFGYQSLPLYVFVNKDKLVEIEAAFERQALCSLTGNWPQALTVAGFLTDGNIFLGTSNVRIIHPGFNVIEDLARYWLNEDCIQPDFCDRIDMNRDYIVNLLDYALLMNINVEFVADE